MTPPGTPAMKPSFDILIKNGLLVTLDAEDSVIQRGCIGISNGVIARIGPEADFSGAAAVKMLDAEGGMVLPGLANARARPLQPGPGREEAGAGALPALARMIRSGSTAFCCASPRAKELCEAADEAGMRAVVAPMVTDSPPGTDADGFDLAEELLERCAGHPRIRVALAPHEPALADAGFLHRCRKLSERSEAGLVLGLPETLKEDASARKRLGKSPLARMSDLRLLSPRAVVSPIDFLDRGDAALLAASGATAALCASGTRACAAAAALLAAGVPLALGAGPGAFDMFFEMDAAAKLGKAALLDPTALPARAVIGMAVAEGLRALMPGPSAGRLSPGCAADLIVLHAGRPHLAPLYNPFSHLVYAARGSDVRHSVIGGRLVMEEGRILSFDAEHTRDAP